MATKIMEKPKETQRTLEMMVMSASSRERDLALRELGEGFERIFHPRSTSSYGDNSSHFLPLPPSPRTGINRGGWPRPADEKERAEFQQVLADITRKETALRDMAQKARNIANRLYEWSGELGKEEDYLLLSVLTEDDRPAVLSYVAAHNRLVRTANAWVAKLAF